MTERNCESFCMAAMALMDGWQPALSQEAIQAHLDACSDCCRDFEDLRSLAHVLDMQTRPPRPEDIWAGIKGRVGDLRPNESSGRLRNLFAVLGLLLVGYRLIEIIPDRNLGIWSRFLPLLIAIAAFGYLKENPFTINAQLRPEEE